MSQKCDLLKSAVQVKEQISEAVVLRPQIRCSEKFCKFHRKISVLESFFNKAAGLEACNPIKARLRHRCFPMKFTKFLRTSVSNKYQIQLKKSICNHGYPEAATAGVL